MSQQSELEDTFFTRWVQFTRNDGLPEPQRQYMFAKGYRKWQCDFCWPDHKLIVEIQGGSFTNGRHNRGAGMRDDYIRHNYATNAGWRILYFTSDMINDRNIVDAIETVIQALKVA